MMWVLHRLLLWHLGYFNLGRVAPSGSVAGTPFVTRLPRNHASTQSAWKALWEEGHDSIIHA